MIELTDIAYVRSGAADLARRWTLPPGSFGLEQVDGGEPGVAHLRATPVTTASHWSRGVGGDRLRLPRWPTEDALALARPSSSSGESPSAERQRGVPVAAGAGVRRLDDPFANRIELVVGQQTLAALLRSPAEPGSREFGHLCLDAPDVRDAYRFWSTAFNAKVSDWIGDGAA